MSLAEKNRHHLQPGKGESRAHNLHHRFDLRKMSSVVNHIHFERHHGFESAKRGPKENSAEGTV